jgi:glutathione synthase/RimK-type ligase-like ATP-grasp enzyme
VERRQALPGRHCATGLPVTPGVFLERGAPADLTRYFEHFDTGRLIVKPCVSGGSKNTFAFGPAEAPAVAEKLRALLPQQAFLVQPFIPQIEAEGEWSLLFFNGRFSHALLKKPVAGDFRVQQHFGGTIHAATPPAEPAGAGHQVRNPICPGCLYARVDGVRARGAFLLMELEIIEPFLYLLTHPDSYGNYYRALVEMVG